MNTEQNYVGGGSNATTPPQMGENQAQALPTPDSRQKQSYQTAYTKSLEELLVASDGVSGPPDGLANTVRALTTVLGHWIKTEYKARVRDTDDVDLDYNEAVIDNTLGAIEFIVSVSEKGDYARGWRKGMSNV